MVLVNFLRNHLPDSLHHLPSLALTCSIPHAQNTSGQSDRNEQETWGHLSNCLCTSPYRVDGHPGSPEDHVAAMARMTYSKCILCISPLLDWEALVTHALVTSQLDYCSILSMGLPNVVCAVISLYSTGVIIIVLMVLSLFSRDCFSCEWLSANQSYVCKIHFLKCLTRKWQIISNVNVFVYSFNWKLINYT